MGASYEIRNTGVTALDVLRLIASGAGRRRILRQYRQLEKDDIGRAARIALDIISHHTQHCLRTNRGTAEDRELFRLRSSGASIDRLARIFLTTERDVKKRLEILTDTQKPARGR